MNFNIMVACQEIEDLLNKSLCFVIATAPENPGKDMHACKCVKLLNQDTLLETSHALYRH